MKTGSGYYVLMICFALLWNTSSAQNLVPNGDFESKISCPTAPGDFTTNIWSSPTSSGADYFNGCAPAYPNSLVSTGQNIYGYQDAHGGNAYAGMEVLYMMDYTTVSPATTRPYLQAHLTSPLVAGKTYNFEMYVSRADSFSLFSQVEICFTTAANRFAPFTPDITTASYIHSDTGWTLISAPFVARGGEEYITIGHFHSNTSIAPFLYWDKPITENQSAYYYFDDVKLEACTSKVAGPLVKDTMFLCNPKDQIILSAGTMSAAKYQWSTGAVTSSLTVNQPGKYMLTLEGVNGFCTIVDSVLVLPSLAYNLELGPNKTICPQSNATVSTSITGVSYHWNTGSTNASITVSSPGAYWLEVTADHNCKNRDSVQVKNSPLMKLELGADRTVCENTPVILDAYLPEAAAYLWSSSQHTSSITVKQAGMYKVTLVDSTCTASDSISVITNPYPVLHLGKDTALCNPDSLVLNAKNDGAKYLWNTGSTAQSIMVRNPGTYIAIVAQKGCASRDTIVVGFNTAPVVKIGNDTLVCQGDNVRLDVTTPGATYKWNTGSTSPSIVVNSPHKYTVEVTRGACKVSDSVIVYHQPKPQLDLGPDAAICEKQQTLHLYAQIADKYLWQDGSAASSLEVKTPGIYWVEISKTVCKVRDSIVVTAKPFPKVKLGNNKIMCREQSLTLDAANPGATYKWNNMATSRTIKVRPPGSFAVKVTNDLNCWAIDSILLDTFVSPVVSLGPDSFVCEGSSLILDAGLNCAEYVWQDGRKGRKYEATHAGIYSIAVKDAHQCIAWDTITLHSRAKPVVDLGHEISVCDPSFELSLPRPFRAYQWQDGSSTPTLKVTGYGNYSVTVTDENYCSNTASVNIINTCPGIIHVPNAFTPLNRDGVNDTFYPVVKNVKSFNFQVYNRWGQLLFESSEINEGWTGQHLNEYMLSDVYIYKVTYTGMDDQTKVVSGDFTLLK